MRSRPRILAVLLVASLTAACDQVHMAVDKTESAYAQQQFNELCARKAGLTINDTGALGGVEASTERVDEALWLLFDVGAPFVELERTTGINGEEDMRQWGPLVSDPVQLWRFERKPEGDPSCKPFRAWLETQRAAKDLYIKASGRWLDPASYHGQCVKFTSAPLSAKTAYGYTPDSIVYRVQEESFFLQRVGGCGTTSQTNRSFVSAGGRRLFQIRSLNFVVAEGCLTSIDGWSNRGDYCGAPTKENLFQGKTILVDTSTPQGEEKLRMLQDDCHLQATCQDTK